MKLLRFFFPIAFVLSKTKGRLVWNVIIHIAVLLLYFIGATVLFLVSLLLLGLLILIPIVSVLAGIAFVVLLFGLLILGMILPFYSAGGITLGVLNYKKILSVLEDRQLVENTAEPFS